MPNCQEREIHVCPLESVDVDSVANLHLQVFPDFFLSFLGYGFLRQYYMGIVQLNQYGLVVRQENTILGFVVGIDCHASFYSRLLKSRGLGFAVTSIPAIIKKPSILPRLFRAFCKQAPKPKDTIPTIQLTSIGVAPEVRGSGIGHRLMGEFSLFIFRKGFRRMILETDEENNESVCRFYQNEGFRILRKYHTPEGRKMIEFEKTLSLINQTGQD